MDLENINAHINAYKENNQILDCARFVIHSFGLENNNLEGLYFIGNGEPNSILLTTNGDFGELQQVMIPKNLFDFDFHLVVNVLAHEMLHVRQKTQNPPMEDKNEREFQAYREMLFHEIFPQIPEVPDFNKKEFAEKALIYYKRMGEGSELQLKYANQKKEVEDYLEKLTLKQEAGTSNT